MGLDPLRPAGCIYSWRDEHALVGGHVHHIDVPSFSRNLVHAGAGHCAHPVGLDVPMHPVGKEAHARTCALETKLHETKAG